MSDKPKIGAGHAAAMARSGLKELAQILPAFPASGVQPVEEPGLAGNPTQREVSQSKGIGSVLKNIPPRTQTQEKGMER